MRACIDWRAQLRNNMNEFTIVQDEKINTPYLMALSSTALAVADSTCFLVLAVGVHHSLFDLATAHATRNSASKSSLGDGVKEELHSLVMGSCKGVLEVHGYDARIVQAKIIENLFGNFDFPTSDLVWLHFQGLIWLLHPFLRAVAKYRVVFHYHFPDKLLADGKFVDGKAC